jgi:hypothetical protein
MRKLFEEWALKRGVAKEAFKLSTHEMEEHSVYANMSVDHMFLGWCGAIDTLKIKRPSRFIAILDAIGDKINKYSQ